ncbi:MAG: hypothetical protein ACP5HM_06025 [Anaerolineae bacterium]
MTHAQNSTSSGSPFWRGVGRVLKVLLRLIFVLVFGVLLGLGFYYGVPWTYRTLIQPVQENRMRIVALEQSLEQERGRVQEEAATLRRRITDLEMALTELRETSDARTQRLDELDAQITETQAQLDQMMEIVAAQATAIPAINSEVEEEMTALEEKLRSELSAEAGAALKAADRRYAEIEAQTDALEGRLALIQTAQDLLKVRLLLLEENPRAARAAVMLAVEHLGRARALLPAQTETLDDLEARLTTLETLIAQNSYRVAPELEALWGEVMDLALPPEVKPLGTAPALPPPPTPTAPTTAPSVRVSPVATPTPVTP